MDIGASYCQHHPQWNEFKMASASLSCLLHIQEEEERAALTERGKYYQGNGHLCDLAGSMAASQESRTNVTSAIL